MRINHTEKCESLAIRAVEQHAVEEKEKVEKCMNEAVEHAKQTQEKENID